MYTGKTLLFALNWKPNGTFPSYHAVSVVQPWPYKFIVCNEQGKEASAWPRDRKWAWHHKLFLKLNPLPQFLDPPLAQTHTHTHTQSHNSHLTVIGVYSTMYLMHPNYCQIIIFLVVDSLFIICLPCDDPLSSRSRQSAHKNFDC